MDDKLRARIAKAAANGPDMRRSTQESQGLMQAGVAPARLVGYYEVGAHSTQHEDVETVCDYVQMVFELSGPKHPVRQDGTPVLIKLEERASLDARSLFFKLFGAMNYSGKATHMAEFLGDPFIVEVFHNPSADGKRVYPSLKGKGKGYNISGPNYEDPATGETKSLAVAAAVSPLKAFFWEGATKEDWDAIYIPGEYPERKDEKTGEVTSPARSRNVIQARIKEALNWKENRLKAVLEATGVDAETRSHEDLERQRQAELKTTQAGNVKELKEAIKEAIRVARAGHDIHDEVSNKRGPRTKYTTRPPKVN